MLMPDGITFKCDLCKKSLNKDTVVYSYLPFEKDERKLKEYCDACAHKLQKEFSANILKM